MPPALPHDVWEWIVGYRGAPLAWLAWLGMRAEAAAARKLQRAARELVARSRIPWRRGVPLRLQYRARGAGARWERGRLVRYAEQWVVQMEERPPRKRFVFVPNDRVRVRICDV